MLAAFPVYETIGVILTATVIWWVMSWRTRRTIAKNTRDFGLGKLESPPADSTLVDVPEEMIDDDIEPGEYRTPFMDLPPREDEERG
ncbi:MAG: hypothetical protein AAF585_09605 [Verrucomicrobiota bacterium]